MGLSAGAIAVWFHRLYGHLGLKGCSSHSGHRTFVTALAKSLASHGGSLRDVQQLAGQASLAMTQRYIEDTATPSAPRSRHGANVAWAADGFATRAQAAQEAFGGRYRDSGFWRPTLPFASVTETMPWSDGGKGIANVTSAPT